MQFVYPSFLWALSLIAIPIIIHLFRFRRFKTVYFSNVSLLKEIKQESNKQQKLKHILVLVSRILAIVFLVLAFAQPFIPAKNHNVQTGKKFVSVYIDNSFSMSATDGAKSLLEEAKSMAREIVNGYAANDKFQLLTNNFSGREQHLIGKEEFLSWVDEVEITSASRSWSEIQKRQAEALASENSLNQIAYEISDFQKCMGDLNLSADVQFHLVPIEAKTQANLFIDSVFFYHPIQLLNQKNQLIVRLKNTHVEDVEDLRVSLTVNGETKALGNVTVPANAFAYDTLNYTVAQEGWNKAVISISDFPITFDDTYFLAYFVPEKLRVLQVKENGSGRFIDAVFQDQNEFELTTTSSGNIQYAEFEKYQLIVLTNLREISSGLAAELMKYLENGGSVLFFPHENLDVASFNNFLKGIHGGSFGALSNEEQATQSFNLNHRLLKNMFDKTPQNMALPNVKKHFPFTQGSAPIEELAILKNRHYLLISEKVKGGNLYLSTSPLDSKINELPATAVFAPLIFEMGISGARAQLQNGIIGDKNGVVVDAQQLKKEQVLKIAGEGTEFIPQQTNIGKKTVINMADNAQKSGFYAVFSDNDTDSQFVAMNYSRLESDLRFEEIASLQQKFDVISVKGDGVGKMAQELGRGTSLWKYALLLSLLFLALEVFLLRFWKK